MNADELDRTFTYETLSEEQREAARSLFRLFREFAVVINAGVPESREKGFALTSLQTALLWCDAAIAIHWRKERK